MQHDVDNLLVSVLETMTFYKGANLIFSSIFWHVLCATPDCADSNDVLGFCSILSLKTSPTWSLLDDFSFEASLVLSIHNPSNVGH
jgi:hypothetical protein